MSPRQIVLACLFLLAGAFAARAVSYALVVGVSDYADPSIVDLEYAASDARDLALVLETQCGFTRHDILLLTDAAATRTGIEAGFEWLHEQAGPGDLAVVYFAGHGSAVVDREGDEADGDGMDECFLPQDAELLDPATYITDDQLGAWIADLGSGAVSLWVDACYSGGQSRFASTAASEPVAKDTVARDVMTAGLGGPVRSVLAACQGQQLAYEDSTLGHGVFTYYLLRGLQDNAIAGPDGVLWISDLAEFVIQGVDEWSQLTKDPQTPMLDMPPGMDTPIIPDVLASRLEGPPLAAYFSFDDGFGEAVASEPAVNHGAELVPGVVGSAARFNNQPSSLCYIRTTAAYEPLEGPFAVALWFRSGRGGANPGALFSSHARYNDYGPEYSAWINGDGSLMFRTDDTRGLNHRQDLNTTSFRWDDGAWHHLVVQRLPSGRKEIWVDGALEASEVYSIQDLRTAANPFTVGGSAYAGWSFLRSFTGDIDELRIYSGALESNRIEGLLSAGLPDATAFVPDPTLAAALRRSLGLDDGATLTLHDLLRVRTLVVQANGPLDLTGLEGCRDLRSLTIDGADLSDLSFVRSFPGLIDLKIRNGHVQSMSGLDGLSSIESVDLSGNQISDLSALATMPSLYSLDLSSNQIDDLAPLAGLTHMKELRLRSNRVSDTSPLGKMTKLWYLDLGSNQVANPLPLVGLPKLAVLLLDGNGINDASAFAQIPSLEELNLAWNQVADVAPLVGLEWLGDYTMYAPGERRTVTLDLSGNAIDDPTPLLSSIGLGPGDSVSIAWNPLRSISPQDLEILVTSLESRGVTVLRN